MLETKKTLERFRRNVVRASRKNLQKKNSTGELHKSVTSKLKIHKNSFTLSFLMEDYGVFQDKGVSGIKKKYNTPFSYKSKGGKNGLKGMPPPKVFDKWNIRRGIAPRDKKGKFLKRKQINFLIAKSIFEKGIKPTRFFTDPFEKEFKKLSKDITEAYALDVEKLLEKTLNN